MILSSFSPLGCSLHLQLSACMMTYTHTHSTFLQDLCTQCWANISARGKPYSQNPFVIRVCYRIVSEVYPVISTKLTQVCYVGCFTFITVLGTSPLSSKTLFAVYDLISISNSRQSSHNFFGELDLTIFLQGLFFSSLMVLSAAFYHGNMAQSASYGNLLA